MNKRLISSMRIGLALFLSVFGTNLLPVATAYATSDNSRGSNGVTVTPLVETTTEISAKALTDHECDATEWHFIITQVDTESHAPASITVNFANGSSESVPLEKYTGSAAHYTTTSNLSSTVSSATADIYSTWSGQFNLSHGPCESAEPSAVATPTVCSEKEGATGQATVTVTNTDDDTDESVEYTVTVGSAPSQTVTVADGDTSSALTFTGLAVGSHDVTVDGDDGTTYSTSVTIAECETAPNPSTPRVDVDVEPCTEEGTTDDVTVTVTNTDDETNESVVYTLYVKDADTDTVVDSETLAALADGDNDSYTFSGLAAGDYYVVIEGDDDTTVTSNDFTVEECAEVSGPDLNFDYDEKCTEEEESDGEASVEIENEGDAAANNLTVVLRDSEGNLLDIVYDVDVAADDEEEVIFDDLDLGFYTIEVWDGETMLSTEEVEVDECGGGFPVDDVCLNIDGIQTEVPEGYVKDGDNCARVLGSNDVCPNITGTQTTVPAGMVKDQQGNCVTDICPNVTGIQTSLPAGYTQVNGQCVAPVGGQGQVLGTTLPAALPVTGSTDIGSGQLLSIIVGFFTYLFLSYRNRKLEA